MMKYLQKLWNKLEIRVLVISSLGLQILLLFLAGYRKHVVSVRFASKTDRAWRGPLAHMFHLFLWLAYLLADYVATVGLAFLRESEDSKTDHLLVFWAPFFLLHLGGQDTITALSIEDNELWSRHLLTFLSQAALALYNYFMLNLHVGDLWPPAALMFFVALFKYSERIWALQRASMSALRSSMITKPDPGPNYAKFMQEYTSSNDAGLKAEIRIEVERHNAELDLGPNYAMFMQEDTSSNAARLNADVGIADERHNEEVKTQEITQNKPPLRKYADIVLKAYEFFPTFKRLFVDLILSYENREVSQRYFKILATKEDYEDAYKLIEIELSWMYDILHSKASVIYTIKYYGGVSRVATLIITTAALILFSMSDHSGYEQSVVALTYVLLLAAVALEVIAFVFMLMSFWTYAVMKDLSGWSGFADFLFNYFQKKLRPRKKSRWSDKMAQFSLITYALQDKPRWWKPVMEKVGFKETWDNYRYTSFVMVSGDLKYLVCQELKKKMENIVDRDGYRKCTEHRGQWALQRKGYYKEFGQSVEVEFDESILLWHIATDLLFYDDPNNADRSREELFISQHISNYLMFLLIARPFMMPAGIGQIRFGDTSAEAKNFLQSQEDIEKAVKMILGVNTEYDPGLVKGDRSKSLLFDGCKLAHELKKQFTENSKGSKEKKAEINWDGMWRLISVVWVEMMCYAASKCSGQFHAKQLSKGGELLTVVWFLMAHLGMGEQYRIEQGHARAKLIVSK
jgi:Domain of unknown function (DUF4220)/Protein of unknown function, DUF594